MKRFLWLVVLCMQIFSVHADFIDDIAHTVVTGKGWQPILNELQKSVERAEKKVKRLQAELAQAKTDTVKKELASELKDARGELKVAQNNMRDVKQKCSDKDTQSECHKTLQEIVTLNNRYEEIRKKIKSGEKNGASAEQLAHPHAHEINSIRTSLAGQKSKIKDMLGLV